MEGSIRFGRAERKRLTCVEVPGPGARQRLSSTCSLSEVSPSRWARVSRPSTRQW